MAFSSRVALYYHLFIIFIVFVCRVDAECPSSCNGRGICNIYNQCECFQGYHGGDCYLKTCPTGIAWSYPAQGVDDVHVEAECSNAGVCNSVTGKCTCYNHFTGKACERLGCNNDCTNRGQCVSMNYYSSINYNLPVFTYSNVWDHDKIFGCLCDDGFTGYDCSYRLCPTGDDPLTTGQADEVQLLKCTTFYVEQEVSVQSDVLLTAGEFRLRYGTETTAPFSFDVSDTDMATALEGLTGVTTVTVTRTGTGVVDDDSTGATMYTWTVSFTSYTTSNQLVPEWRVAEVQSIECAADGGSFQMDFDPRLNAVNLVSIPFDSTAAEMEALVESMANVVDATVWFRNTVYGAAATDDDISQTDQACTTDGNTIYVRLDYVTSQGPSAGDGGAAVGDLTEMTAVLNNGDALFSTGLSLTGGTPILAEFFTEVQKGYNGCRIEEKQTFYCRATGGSFQMTYDGDVITLPATNKISKLKKALQNTGKFHRVSVVASTGKVICTQTGVTTTITYNYPVTGTISTAVSGDMPEATVDAYTLTHSITGMVLVDTTTVEVVKGADCTAVSSGYTESMYDQFKVTTTNGGGSLQVSYLNQYTEYIDATSSAAELQAALQGLSTIEGATVTFSGTQLCQSPANVASVTFTHDFGDLRELDVATSGLYTGGSVVMASDGGSLGGLLSILGTKEEEACAGRGSCEEVITGSCTCFTYYDTSDGRGLPGARGDCGTTTSVIVACPGEVACSQHGSCSGAPSYRCACADGWQGGDCSERVCQFGLSWFDYPSDFDVAHSSMQECSSRGICDRSTGDCTCQTGFFGGACQYMSCPLDCSGAGRCITLAEHALDSLSNGVATDFTYGATPNDPYTWDAHKIHSCDCDFGFAGAGCELRECPFGDDPMTYDDVVEVQGLLCLADSGSFTVSFRGATATIAFDATAEEFEEALEAVAGDVQGGFRTFFSLEQVAVAYTNSSTDSACTTDMSNVISITLDTATGVLPDITADVSLLADSVNGDGTDGSGAVTVATKGTVLEGLYGNVTSVEGTRENVPCSGRGQCSYSTGICACYEGFAGSDGLGGKGTRRDCGYAAVALASGAAEVV